MPTIVWDIDNTTRISGHKVTLEGAPQVVPTDQGRALAFDGLDDAVFLDTDPLEGLSAFTLEALFRPDAGGAAEQRFFHVQESGGESRVLLETRMPNPDRWYLDTFILSGAESRALCDAKFVHPAAAWHAVALVCDGKEMAHYINGERELGGAIAFKPHGRGRTSIGCRINKVFWFKGAVRRVRISPRALAAGELMRA